jgi:galactose mutarotase-like enzyme
MNKTIRNEFLSVTVKNIGAEITSIKDDKNREYMWQADPDVWGRHSPVLFPIVGKLAGNQYRHDGKTYTLNQHGFARDMIFSFVQESETTLTCQLLPTPETKQAYPFDFLLLIHYRLVKNAVEVCYEVKNNGSQTMPFSIGGHPAFALGFGDNDRVTDYYIEFEKPETADTTHLDHNSLLSCETERVLSEASVIPLKEDLFIRDALIFLNLKSEKVSLKSFKHPQRITVDFSGFPYLGIWAKPGADYVCIEPWHGHVDPAGTDGILMTKAGIIRLEPDGVFICCYSIQIN